MFNTIKDEFSSCVRPTGRLSPVPTLNVVALVFSFVFITILFCPGEEMFKELVSLLQNNKKKCFLSLGIHLEQQNYYPYCLLLPGVHLCVVKSWPKPQESLINKIKKMHVAVYWFCQGAGFDWDFKLCFC